VVGDPHRSIDPFFHLHLGRPDVVADLIELPVVGYGPIAAQDARGFEAETPVQVAARGTVPMEIGRLRRRDGNTPVVDRQITLQKLIRRLQHRDRCQRQLLDQSILDGLK
jgi:hypothetical protein